MPNNYTLDEYLKLLDNFRRLQQIHDEQKKIIARLQERNQQLEQRCEALELLIDDCEDCRHKSFYPDN